MRAQKILLSLTAVTAALLIVGAGCDTATTDTNTNSGSLVLPSDSSAADVNAPSESVAAPADSASGTDASANLETYTNSGLGYSFKWPKTGRYAPKWSVGVAKEGDATIKDGCYVAADGKTDTVAAGDTSFCHTAVDAADGASTTDYYVTKKGSVYVVLTFTKQKDAGKDFSWTDYRAGLGQIISSYTASSK